MILPSVVVFPLAVGLAAVAPTLVAAIFDARWQAMGPMLVLLSALSVTRPVGWTIAAYLQALGRTPVIFWLEAFKLASLVLGIVTFGRASPLWTCAAVGLAFGVHAVGSLWVAHRIDAVPLRPIFAGIGSALVACGLMAAAVISARRVFGLETRAPAAALAVEVVVGAVVYLVAMRVIARSASDELVERLRDALDVRRRSEPAAPD
jgi:PST family polysaccharide transporter